MTDFDAAQLPALCDSAIRDLAEVKTIGECLNIINVVEAARIYAQKLGLAQEAQDTCRRIVVMAERKIGQELIEAQRRGELRSDAGRPKIVPDQNDYASTHEEIGITRKQAHEFRQMAELSDDDIDETMAEAHQRGRPVTKADFKRKVSTRREKPSVIPPRPDHLNQLSLWLRNGPGIIRQFADHREAMSLAARFGVSLDPEVVRECVEFLAALCAGLEADRAA